MKAYLLMLVLAVSLALCGCNGYLADQATKRGIQAYDNAKQAQSRGDFETANSYCRQAQQEFQTAVNYDSNGTDRHYNLARSYQDLKEYDRAIREYDEAIRCLPGNGKAHSGKIDCLVKEHAPQEQIDKAVTMAERVVDPSRMGRIYLTQAMAYYYAGRTGDMPKVLVKAAEASPKDAYLQATVGRFYRAIGNTSLAIKHLEIAYELDTNQPGVAYDLGALGQRLPFPPRPAERK